MRTWGYVVWISFVSVVAVNCFHHHVGDGLHGAGLDGVEVVGEGVPEWEEAAVGVVLDDVDGGYVGDLVDVEVVVEDGVGWLVNEGGSRAYGGCGAPDFVDERGCVAAAYLLFGEAWLGGADHVEEYAVNGAVVGAVGVLDPVLGAFAPGVVLIVFVGPFGHALVFDVEEDEVDADGGAVGGDDASHFHECGDAAGAVVSAGDGLAVVEAVGVVVGPEAAVPVRAEEDAVAFIGVEGGDDVDAVDGLSVPEDGGEGLEDDGVAPLAHLGLEVGGAVALGFGAWGAEAEGELVADVAVGRVGGEVGDLDGEVVDALPLGGGRFFAVAGERQQCGQKKQRRQNSASAGILFDSHTVAI